MEDHDQRFKILLQLYFADFLRLFFSTWAERFDLGRIEWLNVEVFPDPPKGKRRTLDLVAKVPLKEPPPATKRQWLALVHVEIEGRDRVAPLRPRMCKAYQHLRDKYDLPVLPIGLYLRVGLDGVGIDVYEAGGGTVGADASAKRAASVAGRRSAAANQRGAVERPRAVLAGRVRPGLFALG